MPPKKKKTKPSRLDDGGDGPAGLSVAGGSDGSSSDSDSDSSVDSQMVRGSYPVDIIFINS